MSGLVMFSISILFPISEGSLRVSDSSALDETRLASRMVGLSLSQTMIPCTETFSCSPTMLRLRKGNVLKLLVIQGCILVIPLNLSLSQLRRVAVQVIKDHDLKFGGTIKFIDGFGELEGKIGNWKYSIVVNKWKEIYERNDATPEYYLNLVFLRLGVPVPTIADGLLIPLPKT
ncbi:hypothetical protein HID58_038531 [Brassica napus]|uniref:Uncharacterized protein n=1 Tax=Brassica napus TaxID=3708 RepID=A0ABQ8BPL5_BRANA|nr:hypothetical protein HID58_038531 [Brassica napus]